ncbi:hypothetical protein PC9H_004099 [Pleurotus ostreatus]|uniref:Uncharacterized protein n=1 Tax=Pleurotus ostreatus TaxID=5322 RepID=A0A8H7A270_PLEOS|nr:uncharacterized protein PC9H_004099 [Pleurotus ostreatus]KAF7437262.1 hypothetical protein PC9H_004099 [Pleurotus ostreatus]
MIDDPTGRWSTNKVALWSLGRYATRRVTSVTPAFSRFSTSISSHTSASNYLRGWRRVDSFSLIIHFGSPRALLEGLRRPSNLHKVLDISDMSDKACGWTEAASRTVCASSTGNMYFQKTSVDGTALGTL